MATRRILIIGSGFGGLGLAIRLKRAGIHTFTILEKAPTLGGTWRDNTYPGAACDVAVDALLLLLRAEDRLDAEVVAASRDSRLHGGLRASATTSSLTFASVCEVARARFDESAGTWTVTTTAGEEYRRRRARERRRPASPSLDTEAPRPRDVPRREVPLGALEPRRLDLAGKRVGVIGNAASAIQFIPEIAPRVRHLTIFQRSANWMIPRGDRAYRPWEKWVFTHVPGWARLVSRLASGCSPS